MLAIISSSPLPSPRPLYNSLADQERAEAPVRFPGDPEILSPFFSMHLGPPCLQRNEVLWQLEYNSPGDRGFNPLQFTITWQGGKCMSANYAAVPKGLSLFKACALHLRRNQTGCKFVNVTLQSTAEPAWCLHFRRYKARRYEAAVHTEHHGHRVCAPTWYLPFRTYTGFMLRLQLFQLPGTWGPLSTIIYIRESNLELAGLV